MIKFTHKGDWSRTNSFLERALEIVKWGELDKYGRKGVEVLAAATPKDTGLTSESWYYEITHYRDGAKIEWLNSNSNKGLLVAILIQYGHALQNGAYVEGIDYINPALKPVFDAIANDAWEELTNE